MPEELNATLSLAQEHGLHATYSWDEQCVYVEMNLEEDPTEVTRVPVYTYGELCDLLGN